MTQELLLGHNNPADAGQGEQKLHCDFESDTIAC